MCWFISLEWPACLTVIIPWNSSDQFSCLSFILGTNGNQLLLSVYDPSSPSCGNNLHLILTSCAFCLTHLLFPIMSNALLNVIICTTTIRPANSRWAGLPNLHACLIWWMFHVISHSVHPVIHSGHVVIWVSYPLKHLFLTLSHPPAPSTCPRVIRQSRWFCTHTPACCLLLPKPWCSPSWNQK